MERTEQDIDYAKRLLTTRFPSSIPVDTISHVTCAIAVDIHAKAIVACSLSGMSGNTNLLKIEMI